MIQQLETQREENLWVLVSARRENATDADLDQTAPSVRSLGRLTLQRLEQLGIF